MGNILTANLLTATAEPGNLLVVAMGVGIVFVGLICIIIVCKLMSLFCGLGKTEKPVAESKPAAKDTVIPDRQQFIAAVSAVIAEEMGTDVSAIRIVSVKKI